MHDDAAETTYKLTELADAAGVSARTVRYYVQRGLLPAPTFRGKDTVYTDAHLLRLHAIRRLQEHYLPLDAIQAELERLTPDALERLVAGSALVTQPSPVDIGPPGPPEVEAPREAAGPAPPPISPEPARASRWERWVLAPGLELHVAEEAAPATRALAEALRVHAGLRDSIEGGRS